MADTILDIVTTLQDVVRAVNNLNQTLASGLPPVLLSVASGNVVVPRGLLELTLGIVQEVQRTYQAADNFADDLRAAEAQLKAALRI